MNNDKELNFTFCKWGYRQVMQLEKFCHSRFICIIYLLNPYNAPSAALDVIESRQILLT